MAQDRKRIVLLTVAALLVTVPIWAPLFDVTGPNYEYRAAPVSVEDDRVTVADRHPTLPEVPGIDCLGEVDESRRCAFESTLLDGQSIQPPYPRVVSLQGEPRLDRSEQYVAFPGDGRMFERTAAYNESARRFVLGLERVDATQALDNSSRPLDRTSQAVRNAVRTGSASTDGPLPYPLLVANGNEYDAVYSVRSSGFLAEKPLTERLLELVAIGLGVLVFRHVETGDRPEHRRDSRAHERS